MNYIIFSIIVVLLLTSIIYKSKNTTIIFLLFLLIFLITKYPEISLTSAKDGITLWIFIVLPALLPFFIVNDMLISLRVPENIARLFTPFTKVLFNTSGYGAYVFIMSIFSGYPSGAKITADLIHNKKITSQEGQKILTFSSTSGPLFIIGVVGSALLKNPIYGYLLIIAHILGAIVNGIVFNLFLPRGLNSNSKLEKSKLQNKPISELLTNAILNSFYTSGIIGGYIIIFSVIIALLEKIEFFSILSSILSTIFLLPANVSSLISNFLKASLEISNGTKILSELPLQINQKLVLLSFIIAFSGLAIIGQVASVLSNTQISLKLYVLSKISQGIISALMCYLLLYLNLFDLQAFQIPHIFSVMPNYTPVLLEALLILILFLNTSYRLLIKLKYARFYKNK